MNLLLSPLSCFYLTLFHVISFLFQKHTHHNLSSNHHWCGLDLRSLRFRSTCALFSTLAGLHIVRTFWNMKGIESKWSGEKPYRDRGVWCRKGNTKQHWQGESVRALCYLLLLLFMTYKKQWRGRRKRDCAFPSFPWLQAVFWTKWLYRLHFPPSILSPPLEVALIPCRCHFGSLQFLNNGQSFSWRLKY